MVFLREYQSKAEYYHDYLHYVGFVAPHVMLLKDGGYMATIQYSPKDVQNITDEEIQYSINQIQNSIDKLEEGWTIQFDYHRHPHKYMRENVFIHHILKEFEDENEIKINENPHFHSSFFITLTFLLPPKTNDFINSLFYSSYKEEEATKEFLEKFLSKTDEFLYSISSAFLFCDYLRDSELLTYIHSCTSLKYQPVAVPDIPFYLDVMLDDVTIETDYPLKINDMYVEILHINDFPSISKIGMLDNLQSLNFGFRYSSRFICMDKTRAFAELKQYRSRFFSKRKSMVGSLRSTQGADILDNTEELARTEQVDDAIERMGNDEFTFGFYTTKIVVYDTNIDQLKKKVEIISRVLAVYGFTTKQEKFNAFEGFLASHPSNVYADVRRPLMQTRTISMLIQSSSPWRGERINTHFEAQFGKGGYHVMATTSGSSLFRLNLNVQDVGHTFVVGPTGSGKSTLLATLVVQFYRYPHAKVVIFDKDRSAFNLVQKLEGLIYIPSDDENTLRFQPLRDVDTQDGFLFALNFIKTIVELKEVTITTMKEKEITKTLELLKEYPHEKRTISNYVELLQSSSDGENIKDILSLYSDNGAWGFLFDGNTENIDTSPLRLFEMTEIMKYKPDVVIPTLLYLFYVVEKAMGDVPSLLIIDEAWLFLQHPVFAKQIESWLKVLRKKHVYVVFATQDLSDASNSSIADTIKSNCKTKIFLPNPSALSNPELYYTFGLSDKDIEIVAGSRPKKEYFYMSELGKRLFSLDLTSKQIEILTEEKT